VSDSSSGSPDEVRPDDSDAADAPDADAPEADAPAASDASDADAPDAVKASAPAKAADAPKKSKSGLSSMVGVVGFVAALGGGFFIGQMINRDDGFAEIESGPRVKVQLRGDEPQLGPDDALVTIIEFADYQCPYCVKAAEPLEEVLEEFPTDVRLIYKHYPLPFHKKAEPAAIAAWAAHQQGKFWEFHRFLFRTAGDVGGVPDEAARLGLDVDKFRTDLSSQEGSKSVDDDMKAGSLVGVRGTPAFVVNGHLYKGTRTFSQWKQIVEAEMDAAKAQVSAGTPRAGVYDKLMEGALEKVVAPAEAREGEPDPAVAYQVPTGADRPTLGPADALVTVVVFSDFQCPYCARLAPTTHEIADKYGVRVVFRQMPLAMHPQAAPAAKASLAAHRQGKFWEMHDALFADQTGIKSGPDDNFHAYAQQIGLDLLRFDADMADPTLDQVIAEDAALARRLGVRGTPASFVNGRFVRGAADAATLGAMIAETKASAQALVNSGTPPAQVYDALMGQAATPIKAGS
jgi:protein-disulfide isomerase